MDGNEAYEFTWSGKANAVEDAVRPSGKMLVPCPEDSVNWETTGNLYLEGDNLDGLKLLQEEFQNQIKLIYIDPPYNTRKDFLYEDNRLEVDWFSMLYARLLAAKGLLRQDGAVCVSIDDNEYARLRMICDEVFGVQNFVTTLIWKSKSGGANDSRFFAVDHEYVLIYAKQLDKLCVHPDPEATVTTCYKNQDGQGRYALDRLDKQNIRYSPSLDYEITGPDGMVYRPRHKDPARPNATWRWGRDTVERRYGELVFKHGNVYTKNYEKQGAVARSLLIEDRFGRTRTGKADCAALLGGSFFPNPKPVRLIRHLLLLLTDSDSLVLDFFSGSATTAQAVMQLNAETGSRRRFLLVQLPESCAAGSEAAQAGYRTICDIGRARIRKAGEALSAKAPDSSLDVGFRAYRIQEP